MLLLEIIEYMQKQIDRFDKELLSSIDTKDIVLDKEVKIFNLLEPRVPFISSNIIYEFAKDNYKKLPYVTCKLCSKKNIHDVDIYMNMFYTYKDEDIKDPYDTFIAQFKVLFDKKLFTIEQLHVLLPRLIKMSISNGRDAIYEIRSLIIPLLNCQETSLYKYIVQIFIFVSKYSMREDLQRWMYYKVCFEKIINIYPDLYKLDKKMKVSVLRYLAHIRDIADVEVFSIFMSLLKRYINEDEIEAYLLLNIN